MPRNLLWKKINKKIKNKKQKNKNKKKQKKKKKKKKKKKTGERANHVSVQNKEHMETVLYLFNLKMIHVVRNVL